MRSKARDLSWQILDSQKPGSTGLFGLEKIILKIILGDLQLKIIYIK